MLLIVPCLPSLKLMPITKILINPDTRIRNTEKIKLLYAVVTVGVVSGEIADAFDVPPFLLRPHFTLARWPSMSKPLAQASAALSADTRSLKLTNAHLDFVTCTIDLSCDEGT